MTFWGLSAQSGLENKGAVGIESYHVVERINMKFGAQVVTYDVSDIRLINTIDLGPNNSRTITPKYKDQKVGVTEVPNLANPGQISVDEIASAESPKYVDIDLLGTYERILEKGYRSEKLLKSVSDEYFFKGELKDAAKWYSELIALDTNLEAVYYYRYAKSLASINQLEKSNEMMKIFESKNL